MELQELKEIMKSEGDFKEFVCKDHACCILRGPSKHLNGYVAIDKNSKFCGLGYFEIDLDVHGGLTFSDAYSDKLPFPKTFKDKWIIGFDCAHYQDLIPIMLEQGLPQGDDTYRTMGYVQDELEKLVNQLIEEE